MSAVSTTRTATMTQQAGEPEVLHVSLHLNPENSLSMRIPALLRKMQDSNCFGQIELHKIHEWTRDAMPFTRAQMSSISAQKNGCNALCLLIFRIVLPAIKRESDFAKKEQLFDFEGELVDMLGEVIPRGIDVETFLKKKQKAIGAVLQYRENVPKINALFQELRQKEFAAANAANAETQKILEDFKQKVQADKAKNQEGATKVEAELRESARRLEQAKQDLHSIVEEAQKQAEQGQKNQDHLKKLSRETQEL